MGDGGWEMEWCWTRQGAVVVRRVPCATPVADEKAGGSQAGGWAVVWWVMGGCGRPVACGASIPKSLHTVPVQVQAQDEKSSPKPQLGAR